MVQITSVCIKDASHPGINCLIEHVGLIFRRLFSVAMEDIKQGEEFSAAFQLLPSSVERHLVSEFDGMLWDLMEEAAEQTHRSLEPMCSTKWEDDTEGHCGTFIKQGDKCVPAPSKEEEATEGIVSAVTCKMTALVMGSGSQAKSFLKAENSSRATEKKFFLPEERAAMITDKETDRILQLLNMLSP